MWMLEDHVLAVGSAMAGFGILATGLLALLFRRPDAPRWTRPEIVTMLLCVPVTVVIGCGLGYAAHGASLLLAGAGDRREFLVPAAVVLVLALAWRGMRIRERLEEYALASGGSVPSGSPATEPMLATGGTPPPRPNPGARPLRGAV